MLFCLYMTFVSKLRFRCRPLVHNRIFLLRCRRLVPETKKGHVLVEHVPLILYDAPVLGPSAGLKQSA